MLYNDNKYINFNKKNAMKTNELRIGNYVNYFSEGADKWFVTEIDINDMICIHENTIDHAEPIPLTEEWLIRFGFKYYKSWNYWQIMGCNRVKLRQFLDDFHIIDRYHIKIETVHKLQNYFFALTDEELIID